MIENRARDDDCGGCDAGMPRRDFLKAGALGGAALLHRVVFDSQARLPLGSRLVRSAREVPVICVCWAPDPAHAAALEHAGVELLHAATLVQALRALKGRGIHSMLVEGGATMASSLLTDALVDRLIIFRAPLLLGAGGVAAFGGLPASTLEGAARWRVVRSARFGDDEMTVYAPLT